MNRRDRVVASSAGPRVLPQLPVREQGVRARTAWYRRISSRGTASSRRKPSRSRGSTGAPSRESSPAALTKQADAATAYAGTLPDVADATADPLGHRLTVRFKSGWRLGVPPIKDGKSGAETLGIKPQPGAAKR